MMRRIAAALAALCLVIGCAGPSKLAEKSEQQLAGGRAWRAWELATRALDREPGNPRARAAAAAAAVSIAQDWERRIRDLAAADSLAAAAQVLEFVEFRAVAAHYTTVPLSIGWTSDEQTLRRSAARFHYRQGIQDFDARRPKQAWLHFTDAERFVPAYRDAAKLADRAWQKALTRVALVPFRTSRGATGIARELATEWRDELTRRLDPSTAKFTRIVGIETVEQKMTVAQLDGLSREGAVRLARKAGADRVVWGSIGGVESQTRVQVFTDVIARRIVDNDAAGQRTTRWVEVPIEVVARVRTATVPVEYEVIATRGGASLAHQSDRRSAEARVVWTSYAPEGDLDDYALVSEPARTRDAARARQVETRWKSVCGERTTLRDVLEARRAVRDAGPTRRETLKRIMTGAAFVFLEELPSAEDLAFAALAGGWAPLRDDLLRLDAIDEVDLGMPVVGDPGR
jgi:hypothetical protein